MKTVFLSLGGNVGRRERMLEEALARLESPKLRITRVSPVYETEPVEFRGQGWFLNLVAEAQTELFPMQLLGHVLRVERQLGRQRLAAKGPRSIDIDILFYGNAVIDSPGLVVPHPSAHERRFVLAPLHDLAPEFRHPVFRVSVREMLAALKGQSVRRVAFEPRLPGRPA